MGRKKLKLKETVANFQTTLQKTTPVPTSAYEIDISNKTQSQLQVSKKKLVKFNVLD